MGSLIIPNKKHEVFGRNTYALRLFEELESSAELPSLLDLVSERDPSL